MFLAEQGYRYSIEDWHGESAPTAKTTATALTSTGDGRALTLPPMTADVTEGGSP
jgi:hypothetical protein